MTSTKCQGHPEPTGEGSHLEMDSRWSLPPNVPPLAGSRCGGDFCRGRE